MYNEFPLVYLDSKTGLVHSFKRNSYRCYEREDGAYVSRYGMKSRYEFIEDIRKTDVEEWVTTVNGFKVRKRKSENVSRAK